MPDDRAAAYLLDEARRLLVEQKKDLNLVRVRATGLLTLASIVASVFATAIPKDRATGASLALIVVFAAFTGMVVASLAVLWPRQWFFSYKVADVITPVAKSTEDDPRKVALSLARKLDANRLRNHDKLESLHTWFAAACAALGVQVLAWLIVIR